MSKHTPGPWSVDEYTSGDSMFGFSPACAVMCRDNNKVICEIPDYTMGKFDREDARLIAAAPELLIELRQAVIQMEMAAECIENKRYDEAFLHVSSLMRSKHAAIAKATGE